MIEETKREDSKTFSDSSRIQLHISDGKLIVGSSRCQNCWLTEQLFIGQLSFIIGNQFQKNIN